MIKKSALILASVVLAGSFAFAVPTADYTPETAPKLVNETDQYAGYDFFGSFKLTYTYENSPTDKKDFAYSFRSWLPFYNEDYLFPIEIENPEGFYYHSNGSEGVCWDIRYVERIITEVDWREYMVYFTNYLNYHDSMGVGSYYHPNIYTISSPFPFMCPVSYLKQFLAGLYFEIQGEVDDIECVLYLYNPETHAFDNRNVYLTTTQRSPTQFSVESVETAVSSDYHIAVSDEWLGTVDYCFADLRISYYTDGEERGDIVYENLLNDFYPWSDELESTFALGSENMAGFTERAYQAVYGDKVFLEQVNPPDLIFGTVESFLTTEFMPDFSFGDLLLIVLGVMVFGAFLKVFLGG